jgi:hypothetical protein
MSYTIKVWDPLNETEESGKTYAPEDDVGHPESWALFYAEEDEDGVKEGAYDNGGLELHVRWHDGSLHSVIIEVEWVPKLRLVESRKVA